MVKMKLVTICTAIGAALAAALGGWDDALKLLVCLMIADYISGLAVALIFKKSPKTATGGAESKAGFKGLCRKGVVLCLVLIGYRLEMATGVSYIRSVIIYGFSANELISLVENAGLMGVPIPNSVTRAIDILKQRSDIKDE